VLGSATPWWRRATVASVAAIGVLGLAACGSSTGSSSPPTSGERVTAPDFNLQGCTFTVDNSVPTGEPTGLHPNFPSFNPDPSADSAVVSIKKHGGTAMVDSTSLPSGTQLYAGPDQSGTLVGTVPSGQSVLLAEPLVWTASGQTWLATFLQCGGPYLYWANLDQIKQVDPSSASATSELIKQLAAAAPYPKSDQASLLGVTVTGGHLEWATSFTMSFPVARGQLVHNIP
jgi:hypothetical protein